MILFKKQRHTIKGMPLEKLENHHQSIMCLGFTSECALSVTMFFIRYYCFWVTYTKVINCNLCFFQCFHFLHLLLHIFFFDFVNKQIFYSFTRMNFSIIIIPNTSTITLRQIYTILTFRLGERISSRVFGNY